MTITSKEKLAYQRDYRIRSKNKATIKYEKTFNGFLMRAYRNMKSRVSGIQIAKFHLYKGKSILSKEDFYVWAKSSAELKVLFDAWELNNYDQKLTPSVDRINPTLGYFIENMRWITHSENSRLGAQKRNKNIDTPS